MNFVDLKKINEEKINTLKLRSAENSDDDSTKKMLELQIKIKNLLDRDDALFFNISADDSFKILKQILGEDDLVKEAYIDLTSPEEYKKLMDKFKI